MKYKIVADDEISISKNDHLHFSMRTAGSGDANLICITREGGQEDRGALFCLINSPQEYLFEERGALVWEELDKRSLGGLIDFFFRFGEKFTVSGYSRGSLYRLSQESFDFYLSAFLKTSPQDPLFILSEETFLYTNPAFLFFTGRKATGENALFQGDLFPDLKRESSERSRNSCSMVSTRVRRYEKLEGRYHLRIYRGQSFTAGAVPEGNLVRAYEERAKKSNRLEMIGLLSSTIAHDLNNTLGVIRGYCDILAKKEPLSKKGAREVDAIRSSAEKGIRLAAKILDAGRKKETHKEAVSLHHKARTAMEMMARLYHGKLLLQADFEADHDIVQADPVEIDQVFMNLLINARDALEGEGHIRIHTENIRVEEREAIHVVLSDDGPGIPDEIVARLFDPFFTTKEGEKGSGLGLYIVKLIITGMGGTVWTGPSSGEGAVFHFLLPLMEKTLKPQKKQS